MNHAVIGLGFGDEGKGLVTDYLSNIFYNPLVVRYSGGQQAGHTVVKDGIRHVFSNFGSGTLNRVPTYWSKYCTVDPLGIMNEYKILVSKGVANIHLLIDEECPVTTPFDKMYNQYQGNYVKNGTCGSGVGQTYQREKDFYSLKYRDLFYPNILLYKLKSIAHNYYMYASVDTEIYEFLEQCAFVTSLFQSVRGLPSSIIGIENYIFEGSQGLMLDQHIGFFPNVTRSNTGSKNILKIVKQFKPWLVTRAYQTRHGNGPVTGNSLSEEDFVSPESYEETNVTNQFQGLFRKYMLDLSLIEYAIKCDKYLNIRDCNIVVTCLEHLKAYSYSYKGVTYRFNKDKESFLIGIMKILNLEYIYINNSPESSTIKYMPI